MKKLLLIPTLLLTIACGNTKKESTTNTSETPLSETEKTETEEELPIITGMKDRGDLEAAPYGDAWFNLNYELHSLDKEIVKEIAPLLEGVKINIFMGTWCSDSQMQVPAFFKIIDNTNFDERNLTLIAMTEDKNTPDQFEKGLDITNVPTIIFYKDGKEMNRIVEAPIESLEKDMLKILKEEAYKNMYAD